MLELLILGFMVVLSYRKVEGSPVFKDPEDAELYERSHGPSAVLEWIRTFNRISVQATGKPCVITSWFRDDHTHHKDGHAVDFRRLSQANEIFPQYTVSDVEKIEDLAAKAGLPIYIIAEGSNIEHWHVGRITRAV